MEQNTSTPNSRGRKIEVVGEVVSNKMNKTISVLVYKRVRHKKYGKIVQKSSVFKAHDESNAASVGDVVKIRESRPLSKTKRWELVQVVESAKT
jgi:small subunit ribosomal protein S17